MSKSPDILIKQINKYKESKNETRLEIILTQNKLKCTKSNIKALKMLIEDIEDIEAKDEMNALNSFLGIVEAMPALVIKDIPMNQDEFIINVKRCFGDPLDNNSLGNKVLDGKQHRFSIKSWYKPDVMLRKFAGLATKESVELDYYPINISGNQMPIYDVCILGTARIGRLTEVKLG